VRLHWVIDGSWIAFTRERRRATLNDGRTGRVTDARSYRWDSLADLAIFIPSLAGGGAERVAVSLANDYAARGLKVDLICGAFDGPYRRSVSSSVRVVDLKVRHVGLETHDQVESQLLGEGDEVDAGHVGVGVVPFRLAVCRNSTKICTANICT
jgi:hypothetical protein